MALNKIKKINDSIGEAAMIACQKCVYPSFSSPSKKSASEIWHFLEIVEHRDRIVCRESSNEIIQIWRHTEFTDPILFDTIDEHLRLEQSVFQANKWLHISLSTCYVST